MLENDETDFLLPSSSDYPDGIMFSDFYANTHAITVRKITGMRISEEDAEDIAHEAYMNMIRYYETFRGESDINGWFHRIVENAARAFLKNSKRRINTNGRELEVHEKRHSSTPNYDRALLIGDASQALYDALYQLGCEERFALVLYADDMTLQKISERQGIPLSTAKSKVFSSIRSMQEKLAGNSAVEGLGYKSGERHRYRLRSRFSLFNGNAVDAMELMRYINLTGIRHDGSYFFNPYFLVANQRYMLNASGIVSRKFTRNELDDMGIDTSNIPRPSRKKEYIYEIKADKLPDAHVGRG